MFVCVYFISFSLNFCTKIKELFEVSDYVIKLYSCIKNGFTISIWSLLRFEANPIIFPVKNDRRTIEKYITGQKSITFAFSETNLTFLLQGKKWNKNYETIQNIVRADSLNEYSQNNSMNTRP